MQKLHSPKTGNGLSSVPLIQLCDKMLGINWSQSTESDLPPTAVIRLKRQLRNDSAIEIIMLPAWCIWKCRNGWIFENEAPTVIGLRLLLAQELRLLQYRVKEEIAENIVQWMQSVQL
jgi:hypothetical protein